MKSLLKYLKDYRKECILAPLFKLSEAILELFVPLVMARIVDIGIAERDTLYIYQMGGLLFVFAFSGWVTAMLAQYYSAVAGVGFGTKLRDALFRHILHLSHKEMDILGKSTLLTRLSNDTNQLQSGVNMFFRLVLRSPFLVIGAFVMACSIDMGISLIFLGIILILYLIVALIMQSNIRLYKMVQQNLDAVMGICSNNLAGLRVIRAFNEEQKEEEEFARESLALNRRQNKVSRIASLLNPLTYLVVNLGIVLVLYRGSFDIDTGSLTKGQMIALVNYLSQILIELVKSANLILLISKSLASAKRVEEIFNLQNSLQDGTLPYPVGLKEGDPILEFKHVAFAYPNSSNEAVTDISFCLRKGESLGIIGGTGSGKSSIVQLIPRFYDATRGEILLAGKDIREYKISDLRKKIALVEQKARLFEGSIRENMTWARQNADTVEIEEALSEALAAEFVAQKEKGIHSYVSAMAKNFSGGQKQRLNIARGLLKKPDILILDDASSALDYMTDAKLRQNIQKRRDTLLIVSQRIVSVQAADCIMVLEDGKIAGLGKHKDLLKNCPVYQEICLSQFGAEEVYGNV